MPEENKTVAEPVNAPQINPPVAGQMPLSEITADELAAPLAANMPEPTKGAGAPGGSVEPKPAESTAPRIESGLKDNAGNVWNPDRYKSIEGSPGTPRRDVKGNFIPLNKGRPKSGTSTVSTSEVKSVMPGTDGKSTQTSSPVAEAPKASVPIAGDGEKTPDKYDHAAEMYFNLLCPMACGVISEEFLPGYSYDEKGSSYIDAKMRDMEKQSITVPLASYMRVNQKDELSPGWALTLASVGYVGRRAQMPQTQKKAKSWLAMLGFGKK